MTHNKILAILIHLVYNIIMKALDELYDIIKIDGVRGNGESARKEALDSWVDKWVQEIKSEIGLFDRKRMVSEQEDTIKEFLCYKMIEDVTENAVVFDITDKKLDASLFVLRRKEYAR